MEGLLLNELAWDATFPHRVAPLSDEWLAGLLLRCDEVNHWGSRTTLTHVLHPGPEKFHRGWRTTTSNLVVLQPSSFNLEYLAQHLGVSPDVLLATTYHLELARLHPKFLSETSPFRLCPQCIAEARLLRRTLALPQITSCLQHAILLQKQCQCRTPLQLFHRKTRPFTCHICGRDWAELPRIEALPPKRAWEQSLLTWYEFFFSRGTPLLLQAALRLMTGSMRKRLSLSDLVVLLVQRGRSTQDVLSWMDRMDRLKAKSKRPS